MPTFFQQLEVLALFALFLTLVFTIAFGILTNDAEYYSPCGEDSSTYGWSVIIFYCYIVNLATYVVFIPVFYFCNKFESGFYPSNSIYSHSPEYSMLWRFCRSIWRWRLREFNDPCFGLLDNMGSMAGIILFDPFNQVFCCSKKNC